jgi:hypothetical protein
MSEDASAPADCCNRNSPGENHAPGCANEPKPPVAAAPVTRCKFRCDSVSKSRGSTWDGSKSIPIDLHGAKLFPVTGGSAENQQFFASTPSGYFEVVGLRHQPFEPGQEYYLDISAAPVAPAA